ncbi:hypothetical protein K438DRAFT_1786472 [Mycena galopus ATCC 62051]|nr:hypothetical protein K438DRAFT_1786472 [Mycena galopus ATCC 62051]
MGAVEYGYRCGCLKETACGLRLPLSSVPEVCIGTGHYGTACVREVARVRVRASCVLSRVDVSVRSATSCAWRRRVGGSVVEKQSVRCRGGGWAAWLANRVFKERVLGGKLWSSFRNCLRTESSQCPRTRCFRGDAQQGWLALNPEAAADGRRGWRHQMAQFYSHPCGAGCVRMRVPVPVEVDVDVQVVLLYWRLFCLASALCSLQPAPPVSFPWFVVRRGVPPNLTHRDVCRDTDIDHARRVPGRTGSPHGHVVVTMRLELKGEG